MQVFRLLDANVNRAREGIRTAEDFIRFEIQNGLWANRLRALRHEITRIVESVPLSSHLINARSVSQDCGHPDVQPEVKGSKGSGGIPVATARRGLKRAQEAMRVLEEFWPDQGGEGGKDLSRIRFELYEAEQWLQMGSAAFQTLIDTKVYVLLSEEHCALGLERTASEVLKGGGRVIQLREKLISDSVFVERARRLKKICSNEGGILIINDRPDIALAVGAEGVHLGLDDLRPDEIRGWFGQHRIIGRSSHTLEEFQEAYHSGAVDYLAMGAMYKSRTKKDTVAAGLEFATRVGDLDPALPVFAIGGITLDCLPELKKVGVKRIAVSSAVVASKDPRSAIRAMIDAMSDAMSEK